MEWHIEYRQDVGIISTEITGIVTLEEVKKASIEIIELSNQTDVGKFITRFYDISQEITLLEIYGLPQIMLGLGMKYSDRIAVIYPMNSPLKHLFNFFDNRCFLSSVNIKVFSDFDTGYRWLS